MTLSEYEPKTCFEYIKGNLFNFYPCVNFFIIPNVTLYEIWISFDTLENEANM